MVRHPLFILPLLVLGGGAFAQPYNDNPCQATPLTAGVTCQYQLSNNIGATNVSGSMPNPGCGGYQNNQAQDVWFVVQVPPNGHIMIDQSPGTLNNTSMAAYSAPSCNGPFTLIACDADASNNGNMPMLDLTGLNPGSYVFIRVWDYYSAGFLGLFGDPSEQGTFSICVQTVPPSGSGSTGTGSYTCGTTPPAGNTCDAATAICTFNGYCGSTQGYTANYWYQGSQGLGGPLNANGIFCGSIENNSFISFIAGSSTVQLQVIVSGSSCSDGVQFMMFGDPTGPACGSYNLVNYGCLSPMAPGSNNFTGSGLTPGLQYYLMVDGFAGDNCTYQINALSGVVVNVSAGSDRTICLGQSAELTVYGAGAGPITWTGPFLNTTSGQTVVATPNAVGTYQYIVTATSSITGNCGGPPIDTVKVTVVNAQPVNVSAGTCVNGVVTLTASGATNYTWSPAGTGLNQTSGASVQVSPSVPTVYTVSGSNAAGCLITTSISVNPCDPNCTPPPFSVTPPASVCAPTTVDLAAAVNVPGGGIVTFHPTINDANSGTNALSSPVVTTSGTYYIRVNHPSNPTCFTVQPIPVDIITEVIVSVGGTPGICAGGNTVLSASGALDYAWSPASGLSATTGASVTASPAVTTTYTVTGTTTGCSGTEEVTVTVFSLPVIAGTVTNPSCGLNNGTVQANVTGGSGDFTYTWSSGGGSATASGLGAGSHTVTVTDNASGCSANSTFNLAPSSAPQIVSVTPTDPGCSGNDGSIVVVATGGVLPYQYSVNGGSTFQSSGTFTGLTAGPYQVLAQDGSGCTAGQPVQLQSDDAPVIDALAVTQPSCSGGDGVITVLASGGAGALTYSINGGTTTQATGTFNGLNSGTYNIVVADGNGCQALQTTVLAAPSLPVIQSVSVTVPNCGANDGSIVILAGSGVPPYQYSVDNGGTFQPTGTFAGLPAGTYPIVVTDVDGCTTTDQATLDPLPVHGSASAEICRGESFFVGGGAQTTSGNYVDLLTTINGCDSILTTTLVVHPAPNPFFTVNPMTAPEDAPNFVVAANGGQAVSSWSYDWGDGTVTTDPDGGHTYERPGTYTITLTVSNDEGCVASGSITVIVVEDFNFFIPNAFTPDGDAVNDHFFGMGSGFRSYDMDVFNRWGEIVFSSSNGVGSWDGTVGGQPAMQGVYPYLFKVTNSMGIIREFRGHVTLLR